LQLIVDLAPASKEDEKHICGDACGITPWDRSVMVWSESEARGGVDEKSISEVQIH